MVLSLSPVCRVLDTPLTSTVIPYTSRRETLLGVWAPCVFFGERNRDSEVSVEDRLMLRLELLHFCFREGSKAPSTPIFVYLSRTGGDVREGPLRRSSFPVYEVLSDPQPPAPLLSPLLLRLCDYEPYRGRRVDE